MKCCKRISDCVQVITGRIWLLWCLAIICLPGLVQGQQFYYHKYTGDDGLSQLVGQALFQDRQGYIWIGTQAGLNRYDGNVFEVLGVGEGLANDWINDVTQDSTGTLWIATNAGASTWREGVVNNYFTDDGLSDSRVLCLAVDRAGVVWAGTRKGLSSWDGARFANHASASEAPTGQVNALLLDRKNRLWIGASNGLTYYEDGRFTRWDSAFSREEVVGLTQDRTGQLWVALEEAILIFDDSKLVRKLSRAERLPRGPLNVISAGPDNTVWTGHEAGLAKIVDGQVVTITKENGFPLDDVRALLVDREGIPWFSGLGGVSKFIGRSFTNYTDVDGLGSNFVVAVTRDRSGTLWAGTTSGLSRFNGRTWRNFTIEDGLNANYVRSLFSDAHGRFWIGDNRGLSYFDGQNFIADESMTLGQPVTSIVEDQGGALWVAIRNVGVLVRKGDQVMEVKTKGQTFSDARLLADSRGNIWASGDKGLSRWDGSRWRTFTTWDDLADNQPYFLCEDHFGRIWFGYHSSRGVTVFDGSKFTTYTTADGLSNDAVYSIGVDHTNNIWIGTARGVDRFDGEHFVNYGKAEGYASSESNAGGFFADRDSSLWFGTAEGLSHYDSQFDLSAQAPTTPIIHSVTVGGKRISFEGDVVLPRTETDLSIRIAPLSYINPKHLSFRYRLLGASDGWKPLDGHIINFTHLQSGSYRLEVQGRKHHSEWSAPATLGFVIKPVFWKSWWFVSIALIGLVAVTFGIFKYYMYKIQSRNRWLERTISERTTELRKKNQRLAKALTKHKEAERALKDSEKRLRDFFESSPDAIFVEDVEGNVLDVNPAACHLHKMEREVLIGRNVFDLVPPNQCDKVAENTVKLANGELTHFEGLSWTHDGEAIPVEVRASKIVHSGKGALLLHVRDVSERKQAELELSALNQELLASERQLSATNEQLMTSLEQLKATETMLRERGERIRLIIDTAHDAVIAMDSAGLITAWNKQAEVVFGWSIGEALGLRVSETIIPPKVRAAYELGLERFLASGESEILNRRFEMTAIRRNGDEFPVEVSIAPLRLGDTFVFSAFIRDITDRKRTEQELRTATEVAKAANLSKSEFLANMSHEIRTPLNAIIGMTELILDTELSEEQSECLKVVQSSSESLLALINDILDFSKIEAGQMELEEIAFDLREVVENVTDIVRVRAVSKGIELLCYVDPLLRNWLVGDKTRLQQILINLVGNAIKFTEVGEVSLRVEPVASNGRSENREGKVGLHFKVCDTGIGISNEQKQKVFEKFSQADSSTTRKFGGTGLGLSISRSLVEMMGGELEVESEMGKGSIFQFKIFLSLAETTEANSQNAQERTLQALAGLSVLVVDDNETNRFILNHTLKAWSSQVLEAASAFDALAILDEGKTKIDLVILDHQMPEMDGIELAAEIRKRNLPTVKMVLLSSWGDSSKKLNRDLDIAATVTKPVKQSKLLEVLQRVLFQQEQRPAHRAQEGRAKVPEHISHARILLAEDNPDNQNLAKRILKKGQYRVDMAPTGRAAVELAAKFRYSLILMDIQMPDMDGFAATKKIRDLERSHHTERVPIVALTAHALKGYREKCLAHDMDDFITKPLKKKVLLDTVIKWIDPRPTILIKEAVENSLQTLRAHLAPDQYKVLHAQDVEQTLKFFTTHPVSVVVVDLVPENSSGLDLATAIRRVNEGDSVPIVALVPDENADMGTALARGVTECLPSSVALNALQEVVSRLVDDPGGPAE